MKLLMENFRKYLKEIGDLSLEPYEFEDYGDEEEFEGDVYYTFTTQSGTRYNIGFVEGMFTANHPWLIDYSANESTKTTEENEPLKIMSTIVAIIKDFISRPKLNQNNLKFSFEGIPKGDEEGEEDAPRTARTKMYLKFLKKNLPRDWHFRVAGENEVFFGDHAFWEKKENDEDEDGEQETF